MEPVLSALFAKGAVLLLTAGLAVCFGAWYRRRLHDKVEGEPLLSEQALVHAKSDYSTRYSDIRVIHFYIAARDTVVDCDLPYWLWKDIPMKSRGILTHQGGKFHSFETPEAMYCEASMAPPPQEQEKENPHV